MRNTPKALFIRYAKAVSLTCIGLCIIGIALSLGYFVWFVGDDCMVSWRIAHGEGGPPYPTWWQSFHATSGYVWLLCFIPSLGLLYWAGRLIRIAWLGLNAEEKQPKEI